MSLAPGTAAGSRAAVSDVVFLGAFFTVFLGEAGFFVPFDATTFFVCIIARMAGCLVFVASIFVGGIAAVGFLVGVDALAAPFMVGIEAPVAPFLVGVEATTISFLGVNFSVGVGLLLGSELLHRECAPSWG